MSEDEKPADEVNGFDLKSVCWGYREVFAQTIQGLFDEGAIGPERREVTTKVFEMLRRADQGCFDHVLKEFLTALNPRTRWLLELPGLFADLVELGGELADARLHYGIRYFETLGAGGFGDTPDQVRFCLNTLRRLREIDDDLALAFLRGYRRLIDRLRPEEIGQYLQAGLESFRRSRKAGLAFLEGSLKTSETYVVALTRECRLTDVAPLMERLLRALAGREIAVEDLSGLDSDELIDRGSRVICLTSGLYVPARIRDFDNARLNRAWYLLLAVTAAGMVAEDSFPRVHGDERYQSAQAVAGSETLRLNLFQLVEQVRVLRRMARRWPGVRGLLGFALRQQRRHRPPADGTPEQLFHDALADLENPSHGPAPAARPLVDVADSSVNFFDTAERLGAGWATDLATVYPQLAALPLAPSGFLPDMLFPARVSAPPLDSVVADLKSAAGRRRTENESDAGRLADHADGAETGEAADETAAPAAYVYDEWSQDENDYYRDYCFVRERHPHADAAGARAEPPADIAEQARKVSRIFERFKPDLVRRERRLREGDAIDPDLLTDYLVRRRNEPSPKVDFYERPVIARRDLAVLILLDASGSTGELAGERRVIDVEKHAAVILGQALASLGDRFAVCGFSTNGREDCIFHVYKDFDDTWDRAGIAGVLAAYPANSTRIGAAMRHAGYRLSQLDARRRLILLITDGKPMDAGYDPNSRYAQHDVRMACEENARKDVHAFGISTQANSLADMEIMFPRRRFALLPDIRHLPRVLPKLYVKLTV